MSLSKAGSVMSASDLMPKELTMRLVVRNKSNIVSKVKGGSVIDSTGSVEESKDASGLTSV